MDDLFRQAARLNTVVAWAFALLALACTLLVLLP
jgi:hypothetical protein